MSDLGEGESMSDPNAGAGTNNGFVGLQEQPCACTEN